MWGAPVYRLKLLGLPYSPNIICTQRERFFILQGGLLGISPVALLRTQFIPANAVLLQLFLWPIHPPGQWNFKDFQAQGSVYSRGRRQDAGIDFIFQHSYWMLDTCLLWVWKICGEKKQKHNKHIQVQYVSICFIKLKYRCKFLHHCMQGLLCTLLGNTFLPFATDVSLKNVFYFSWPSQSVLIDWSFTFVSQKSKWNKTPWVEIKSLWHIAESLLCNISTQRQLRILC